MRVLLVSAYYRPHIGGVERFTENLAHGLAARGHAVEVLACRTEAGAPARERRDGVTVHRVPSLNPFERRLGVPWPIPAPRALARAVADLTRAADVVHVQDVLYATSLVTLHRSRAPVVLTQHIAHVPQRSRALDAVERLAYALTRRAARRAAARAAYNPDIAAWASRYWDVEVGVLPVASEAAPAEPDRAGFGLPSDRFVALFVGRDVVKKRLDVVAAAADDAYELVLVTDAKVEPRRGLRVIEPMPAEDLARLMRSVDAFVLPSYGEGIPLSLQEAMSAGLPVVTSFNAGYERYFTRTDVLTVEPHAGAVRSALRRLAHEPELRRRLSERSSAVAAASFALGPFVAAYEQLYERVLAAR